MRLTDLYKERRAERRLARRERARAVLREHWPRIIRERLRFSPIKPNALAHPCGKRTATPLKNLKLDADCVVKRNVERRVRPETIKVPRKYLVAKKMRLRGAELGAKRRMMERKEVTAVGKLLKQFELLQVRDASAAPITASMTAKA